MTTPEIEGMGRLREIPNPMPPQCEAATAPKWYRPEGGRCPWRASYVHEGRLLCRVHALVEERRLREKKLVGRARLEQAPRRAL